MKGWGDYINCVSCKKDRDFLKGDPYLFIIIKLIELLLSWLNECKV